MLQRIRRTQKLPRGSFFYVKVGDRFYGGEDLETQEVKVQPKREDFRFRKGEKPQQYWSRRYGSRYEPQWGRDSRSLRDRRKNGTAGYLKGESKNRPAPAGLETKLTGQRTTRLVDQADQAKQYRRRSQADSACERIQRCYAGLDVKVTVEYKEGSFK